MSIKITNRDKHSSSRLLAAATTFTVRQNDRGGEKEKQSQDEVKRRNIVNPIPENYLDCRSHSSTILSHHKPGPNNNLSILVLCDTIILTNQS